MLMCYNMTNSETIPANSVTVRISEVPMLCTQVKGKIGVFIGDKKG